MLLFQTTLLISVSLSIGFRRIYSIIFSGTDMIQFPRFSFLPSSKMGKMFPIFQSAGILPDHHDFSNITEWLSGYIRQYPQASGMHLICSHRHTYTQIPQMVMNLILVCSASDLTPSVPALSAIHSQSVRRGGALKAE